MPVQRPVPEPPSPGWWTELSYRRHVDRGRADRRDRELANEQARRRRQLRRRVERVNEQLVLAEGASEARRQLARRGIPYEARSEVEHFTRTGRILSVR